MCFSCHCPYSESICGAKNNFQCNEKGGGGGGLSNISNFGLDVKNKFIQLCLQKTSSDARPWTHHQCCFQESLGVSSLTTDTLVLATQPRLIRPRPVSKWHSTSPTALPSLTTAIWTLFLLPPHCCLWLFFG